jgi:mannan endo-1,4-beta-mannosidase
VLARTQEQSFDADLACDNNIDTRWDSNHDERVSWIAFDYEKVQYISTVLIIWEQAHATTYAIEYSNDAENWREIWKEYEGDGNIDLIQFTTHVRARYLRLKCTQKANDDWGYSVYEFQAFGKH